MRTKTCTFLLLLLGLALEASSHQCPDPDRLPTTCECEDGSLVEENVDLELSCSGSTVGELRDALVHMDKSAKLEIHLDEMELSPLPSDIFDGLKVVVLDISHCEFDGHLPLGLEDSLEELSVSSSFTQHTPSHQIDVFHLKNLRELDLSYNAITRLSDDWFGEGPANLKRLVLSNNGIRDIDDHALANFAKLEYLSLDGNRFGNLKRSVLPRSADRLNDLQLENNDFTSLPDDLLDDMPALRGIVLDNNQLTHLTERVFKKVWPQLHLLAALGNPLECGSKMDWMKRVRSEAAVLGTCNGGQDLEDFVESGRQ